MFMNKPAKKGTFLPWCVSDEIFFFYLSLFSFFFLSLTCRHQDRWTYLSIDPLVTIWAALDPSTVANGCVQVIPKSHHYLINKEHTSGFLTDAHVAEHVTPKPVSGVLFGLFFFFFFFFFFCFVLSAVFLFVVVVIISSFVFLCCSSLPSHA
jgi:hypothetical protein